MSSKFVYKFEMTEEDWLSIHDRLDEAIRLLHSIDGICDDCLNIAISADDALSDLESSIHDYEIKEEPEMGSEERIKLEMDMSDYGYIINALKIMQRNIVGRANIEPYMRMLPKMCLNILERSIIEEPEEGIEMSEEEWNKIRNGAMPKSKAEESNKPTSGRYEWKDNMPIYGPDPWKDIDILKETIKKQSDMIGELKDHIKSNDNADNALGRRVLSIENQLGRELYDYKNKVALDIASIDNRIHDYDERLTTVEDQLGAKIVDIALDNKNNVEKLFARTNRLYELIDANIKLDNKTDILEERLKNITETVDSVKTQLEDMNNLKDNIKSNNYDVNALDRKFEYKFDRLWDIVTGDDDSLDERVETLSHRMDALIERDECLFNKLHSLKDDMKELAQSNADKHNRLAMQVQNLKDFVEGKHDKGNLDISSASFNIYFDRNKKEDDDE